MDFIEKRAQLASEYEELNDNTSSYGRLLKKYSVFDRKSILKVLCEIASAIEGIEFLCIETHSGYGSSIILEARVYDCGDKKFLYDIDTLKKLRKVLFIQYDYPQVSELGFYQLSSTSIGFEMSIDFKGFSYLEEFINRVVSYRFNHEMEKISPEELNRLKYEFLVEKLEEKRAFYAALLDEANKNLVFQEADENK